MRNKKNKRSAIFLFFSFICITVNAQEKLISKEEFLKDQEITSFEEYQSLMNEYFILNPNKKEEKIWKRQEWFLEPRLHGMDTILNIKEKTQEEFFNYQRKISNTRSTHGSWNFLGHTLALPGGGSNSNKGQGRVNRIDIHPTNPSIIYVCAASGGIWKSVNGGSSWSNITPNLPFLSFADLEIDHTNPNTIYALSGDGNVGNMKETSHFQSGALSSGIMKSTDGGITWFPVNYKFAVDVFPIKLKMHPTDPLSQFITSRQGLFRTDDGWNTATFSNVPNIFDLEFHPTNPNIAYVSSDKNIWRSTTGGTSWTQIADVDINFSDCSRIELAVTPDFPTLVYALAACSGKSKLYASYVEGPSNTWAVKDTTSDLVGPFLSYAMGFEANPNNYKEIIGGGISLFRSLSEGSAPWTGLNQVNVHRDAHDIVFNNGNLYLATDGGIHVSTDGGNNFSDISTGLAITEVYTVTGTPNDVNKYITGAQDVGHNMRESNSTIFKRIGCCDGMISIIDHTNPDIIYVAGQGGGINKSTDGGMTSSGVGNPGNGGAWNTPYIMDHTDSNVLFVGRDSVHRSDDGGGSWNYIGSPTGTNINVLRQGLTNRNIIYASIGSRLFVTYNAYVIGGPSTWHEFTSPEIDRFVTDIKVSPFSDNIIFITLGGYDMTSPLKKVYRGTRITSTEFAWVNWSGSLPDLPILNLEYHYNGLGNDAMYVGTDIGVFYKDNDIGDWIYFSNGLPMAPVSDLYLNPTNNTIAAGTYGRGLWRSSLYTPCIADYYLTNDLLPDEGTHYYSSSNTIISDRKYDGAIGTSIHYKAGNYIDLLDGFEAKSTTLFTARLGPCPDFNQEPLTQQVFPKGRLIQKNENASRN